MSVAYRIAQDLDCVTQAKLLPFRVLISSLLKNFCYLTCMGAFLALTLCTTSMPGASGHQKGVPDPLKLEYRS